MTHERFEILAQAYGGDIARWPAPERDAARPAARLAAAEATLARLADEAAEAAAVAEHAVAAAADLPDLGGAAKLRALDVTVRTLVSFEGH